MHRPALTTRRPRLAIAALAMAASAVVGAGVVLAAGPAIVTFTPKHADQITNIDVLRQQIRNYYGDELGTGVFGADSNYAKEACSVADKARHYIDAKVHEWGWWKPKPKDQKAVLFDVDDTTLATWNYEIASNWAFNPATNGQFVTSQLFPAVPCMVDLAKHAAAEGYSIFFLTGRGATQEAATLGNLTADGVGVDAGYPAPSMAGTEDGLFTKPAIADYPQYLLDACAEELALVPQKSCTTTHYKTATRAHIESLGYDIVANLGDQFSDLNGGFADKTFKMPNPNYFLP